MNNKLYPGLPADRRLGDAHAFEGELKKEGEKRKKLEQRCKKVQFALDRSSEVCGVVSVTLSGASVGLLVTGIGLPTAIPTAAVSILAGAVDLVLKPARVYTSKKLRRHTRLKALAENNQLLLSRLMSKTIADETISDAEFQCILDMKENWIKARNAIFKSTEKELRQLTSEFRKRLAEIEKRF